MANSMILWRRAGDVVLALGIALAAAPAPAQSGAETLSAQKAAAVRAAVERVRTRVVQLQTVGGGDLLGGDGASRATTGVLLSAEGHVVTSSYGFDPRPASVLISFDDGSRAAGRVLAVDHNRQIAVLLASRTPEVALPELEVAPAPRVGETAIAVGRSYRADATNLAVGVVSAVGRLYGRATQTDAATSPANYGGLLIDLRGRALGVLTPLSPSFDDQATGVGWYDSGIGFAVPLTAIEERLPGLAAGEDVHRGVAGIAFANGSDYARPAKLRTVHPGGPAAKAGLRAGDVVQQVNGQVVECANDFKLVAHASDAGQTLQVAATREGQPIEAVVVLAAELSPYRHPYLGVIARRDGARFMVTAVVDGSPAAAAGLRAGDVIKTIASEKIASRAAAITALAAFAPGDTLPVSVERDGKPLELTVEVGKLRFDAPAHSASELATKEVEIVTPGSPRKANLVAPAGGDGPFPALVWLGGRLPADQPIAALAAQGALVVEPEPFERGVSAEAAQEYLDDLLNLLTARDDVDPDRLAIGGAGRPAALAVALGMADQSRFTGIVVGRWSGRPPRVSLSSPDRRHGVLILGSSPRDETLAGRIKEVGYPVEQPGPDASAPAVAAGWLNVIDCF